MPVRSRTVIYPFMEHYNDESRAQVARGWEQSGADQAEYARQHGISERTLRAWRRRFCPPGMPVEAARVAILHAIGRLQVILVGLDAEAACRPVDEEGRPGATQDGVAGPQGSVEVRQQNAAGVLPARQGLPDQVSPPGSGSGAGKAHARFFDWEASDPEPVKGPEPVVQPPFAAPPTKRQVPEGPVAARLPMPGMGVLVLR